jgi:hypothetical protein
MAKVSSDAQNRMVMGRGLTDLLDGKLKRWQKRV